MTDDDRMDRARRIREMREGSGPGDGQPADGDGDDDAADAAADDDVSPADDAGEDGDADADADLDPDVADGDADAGDGDDSDPSAGHSGDDGNDCHSGDDGNDCHSGDGDPTADHAGADDGTDGPTIPIAGAEIDDVSVDPGELARQAGLDAGDGDAGGFEGVAGAGSTDDDAGPDGAAGTGGADGTTDADGTAGADATGATAERDGAETPAAETRVLEFDLGAERYCLDIEYVEEIVRRDTVTRVPNTPAFVAGVVDLRGQITTILDPTALLDVESESDQELIVVFDPEQFDDQGAIGWLVDDVNQVTPVPAAAVNDAPTDDEHVNGVVERDGEFVIWAEPRAAIENAAG